MLRWRSVNFMSGRFRSWHTSSRMRVYECLRLAPVSCKGFQQFLGFTNLFINFGQVAAALSALTSSRSRFLWSSMAQTAFDELKNRFIRAPILITPDPTWKFVVEVDASEEGVGVTLSGFFSKFEMTYLCLLLSPFGSHRAKLRCRQP